MLMHFSYIIIYAIGSFGKFRSEISSLAAGLNENGFHAPSRPIVCSRIYNDVVVTVINWNVLLEETSFPFWYFFVCEHRLEF